MKNKSTLSFFTFLIVSCFSLCFINNVNAQENGIYELKNNIGLSKSSSKITKKQTDRKDFNFLAYKLHTTIYIKNGIEKNKYGKGLPIKLTLEDTESLRILKNKNSKYAEVQLLTISVKSPNDLNTPIDLSNIPGLKKLKYIFIKNNIKSTKNQIRAFIKANPNVRIFYTSETPS